VLKQIAEMMGAPMSEWDGMAIFEGESYAKIFEVSSFDFRFHRDF
jgi:hypothetical protein